jgi:APA family basic amino acid/polyamine antiporter
MDISESGRKLGFFGTMLLALGGAIGFEIFVLLDYAYFSLAGPGVILALVLCGFVNLLTMFSYAECCAVIPEVGGEYTYTKVAYGGFVAFMTGCARWLASVFGAALAAVVFAQQLGYFFSIVNPPSQGIVLANAALIAAFVIVALSVLSVRGTKKVGILIVSAFIIILTIFIVSGFFYGLAPPEGFSELAPQGLSGILVASGYVFPMFVGMRALVAGTPMMKDPEKDVPRAMIATTILLTTFYFVVAYVVVGVAAAEDFVESPLLNFVARRIMGDAGGAILAVVGMVGCLASISTALMVQSSIARGMSRDGYLPKVLLSVHGRFGTPYLAVMAGAFFVILFSIIGEVQFLGYAASFGSLLVFALVNFSLMKLRRDKPHLNRRFKAPLYPLTPIIGIIMAFVLLTFPMFLARDVNAISALMADIGLVVFVLLTYYLKMIGYHRLRVAVGGACLGIGILTVLLIFLGTEYTPPFFLNIPSYILIFISAIFILAGILNITGKT